LYINVGAKTLAAFSHVLAQQEFDFLFRTNTSSYVNKALLSSFVNGLPRDAYYGGFVGWDAGIPYASGTGILLSRDLVEAAVRDPQWEFDYMDDVALGRSMHRAGIAVNDQPRIDLPSITDLEQRKPEEIAAHFLVRCRSAHDRSQDAAIMRRVHTLCA
jgi:hypothetical protein